MENPVLRMADSAAHDIYINLTYFKATYVKEIVLAAVRSVIMLHTVGCNHTTEYDQLIGITN